MSAEGRRTAPSPTGVLVWTLCALLTLALLSWAWESASKLYGAGGDPGRVGDWLINYAGGFVRRGLTGALLHVTGEHALGVIISMQVVLYAGLLVGALALLWRHCKYGDVLIAALFASPATFVFEALHAEGYRKELLGFGIILVFALMIRWFSERAFRWFPGVLASFVPLVLIHEGLVLFLPYVLLLALCEWPDLKLFSRRVVIPVALVCVCFLVVVLSKTPPDARDQILESWRGLVPESSLVTRRGTGAIRALGGSTESGFRLVIHRWDSPKFDYGTKYAYASLLAAVPFALNWRRCWTVARERVRFALLAVAGLITVVLILVAVDWGRFIYMNATAFALVVLGTSLPGPAEPRSWRRVAALLGLGSVIFVGAFWRLPISSQPLKDGWGCRVPGVTSLESAREVCSVRMAHEKRRRSR